MASPQRPAQPHRRHQGDAEDHQGHADGRGLEAAPRAGGGRGGAALCGAAWTRCSATSPASVAGIDTAPRLLRGTGSDQVHLLLVCTAERGLCGPFNSSIVRLARERANALMREGKEVKIFCVGRKGYDQLRRLYEQPDRRDRRPARRCARSASRTPRRSPRRSSRCFDSWRVRRLHAVLLALPLGDRADPDRAADHPAGVRRHGRRMRSAARPTNSSRTRRRSCTTCCRATSRCRSSARCWRTPPRSRRADERDGQRHPQRRRHDQQADADYNRTRQAMITKELIEIISGAEAL